MSSTTIDPITLAVVKGSLEQIAEEMDLTLKRAAFSPTISEGHDRANGFYDAQTGNVIVQGFTGLPIFIGIMQFTTQAVIRAGPIDFHQGARFAAWLLGTSSIAVLLDVRMAWRNRRCSL